MNWSTGVKRTWIWYPASSAPWRSGKIYAITAIKRFSWAGDHSVWSRFVIRGGDQVVGAHPPPGGYQTSGLMAGPKIVEKEWIAFFTKNFTPIITFDSKFFCAPSLVVFGLTLIQSTWTDIAIKTMYFQKRNFPNVNEANRLKWFFFSRVKCVPSLGYCTMRVGFQLRKGLQGCPWLHLPWRTAVESNKQSPDRAAMVTQDVRPLKPSRANIVERPCFGLFNSEKQRSGGPGPQPPLSRHETPQTPPKNQKIGPFESTPKEKNDTDTSRTHVVLPGGQPGGWTLQGGPATRRGGLLS